MTRFFAGAIVALAGVVVGVVAVRERDALTEESNPTEQIAREKALAVVSVSTLDTDQAIAFLEAIGG